MRRNQGKADIPKAFEHVLKNYRLLVRRTIRYGTRCFQSIICRTNIEDVKELARIAHENGHFDHVSYNEAPMMDAGSHFKHLHENDTLRPDPNDFRDGRRIWLDWSGLTAAARVGRWWTRFRGWQNMKGFMRGKGEH